MEDLVGGALLVSPHLVRGGVLGTPVLQQEGDAAQILDLASRHYINTTSTHQKEEMLYCKYVYNSLGFIVVRCEVRIYPNTK